MKFNILPKVLFVILLSVSIPSCNNDDEAKTDPELICSVLNPTHDLGWLKSEIEALKKNSEQSKYDYITQAKYNEKTIFIFANCNPIINSVLPVKNCSGEFIGIIGSRQQDIPFDILKNGMVIWKSDNSECNL